MFEVFEDQAGKWRWRLKSKNNEILATSEAYEGGQDAARRGIVAVCDTIEDALIAELRKPAEIAAAAKVVDKNAVG